MSVTVKIEWHEYLTAALVGVARQIVAEARDCNRPLYSGGDEVITNIQGATAELAAAKVLNLYWGGIGLPKRVDIGRDTEVRHTEYPAGGLLIKDKDEDSRPYVLVRGTPPFLEVVGWMYGRDAKQQRWRKDGYFLVPGEELVAINEFRAKPDGGAIV